MRIHTNQSIALVLLLLLGFVWGSGYTLARFATTHGVSPLGYAFWQSFGPAVLLLLISPLFKARMVFNWRHIRFYFVCGLIGIALPNTNMYFAAPHLPAGLLAVIVNTVPIMTYVLAFALGQERFYFIRLVGVVCAIAGIALIVIPHAALPSFANAPWALLALVTPFCFALCAVFIASQKLEASHPVALSAGMMIFSTLLLTPVVISAGNFYWFQWPLKLADGAVLLEMVLASLGFVMVFKILEMAGAIYYSMVGAVVALTGLFWGWLVFGETLNQWTSLAVAFILFGIVLVTFKQVKK